MAESEITVVIPTWDRRSLLRGCLESLRRQTARGTILVVDNGSSDGTAEMVESEFPEAWVLRLAGNLGFAAAVNRGILTARTPFLALLNNDTEADPGWLEAGLTALRTHPQYGFFASRMLRYHDRSRLDSAGDCYSRGGLPTKRGFGQPSTAFGRSEEVLAASAGAAFYRREVFEKAGLFDENYHLYLEDVELSLRAQLEGFRCLYLPDAVVHHIEAASDPARRSGNGCSDGAFYSETRVFWITRNRWQLMVGYQPFANLPRLTAAWLKSLAFHLLRAGFTGAFLRGWWAGIRLTGEAWKKRDRLRSADQVSRDRVCRLMRRC